MNPLGTFLHKLGLNMWRCEDWNLIYPQNLGISTMSGSTDDSLCSISLSDFNGGTTFFQKTSFEMILITKLLGQIELYTTKAEIWG